MPECHLSAGFRLCRATGGFLLLLRVQGSLSRGLACLPDNGLGGFAGACLQGSCGRVVGEGDPAIAQVPGQFWVADLMPGVCSAPCPLSPPARRLGPGQEQVQGGQVRKDAVFPG